MKVARRDLLGNAMAVADFRHRLELQRLTKRIERVHIW